MTEIRRIRQSEAPEVADLWGEYTSELGEPFEGLSAEARRGVIAHLEANSAHDHATCLVAVEPEQGIVGFATAATFIHPTMRGVLGEIEEIYVHPDHRRQGVGTTLARSILDWIDAHGGDVMKVRVGRGLGEGPAVRFWESLGFEADMVECSLYPAAQHIR